VGTQERPLDRITGKGSLLALTILYFSLLRVILPNISWHRKETEFKPSSYSYLVNNYMYNLTALSSITPEFK
jgi:hypothetical protein